MAYRIAPFPETLSDLKSHSPIATLFRCDFWATVCKTVRPMLSDCCPVRLFCLSCQSVTLVCCGQTVGRIKMKLGVQVGLVPGNIVLDGDPAPPKKGTAPNFRLMSVVAKRLDGLTT